MELNLKQVRNALEHCINNDLCDGCPIGVSKCHIIEDSLSLINELTEENESLGAEKEHLELVVEGKLKRTSALEKQVLALTEENERLRKALCREDITIVRARANGKSEYQKELMRIKVDAIRADTVRKMQERLDKHFCHDPAFLGVEQRLIMDVIDQIAEEMLEGTK